MVSPGRRLNGFSLILRPSLFAALTILLQKKKILSFHPSSISLLLRPLRFLSKFQLKMLEVKKCFNLEY
jgi:hypothetical protein